MEKSITSDDSYEPIGEAPSEGNTINVNCRHTRGSSCEVCAQLRKACSKENELGRGAFGVVHRVDHAGEQYAIKVMRCSAVVAESGAQQEAASNSVWQEMRATANLYDKLVIDNNDGKRYLVSIRDVCVRNVLPEVPDRPVVVMELCGEKLKKCIKAVKKHKKDCEQSGGWTLAHTRNVAQHVAKGISYLQSHGLVHCDLKMGNVVASTSVAELLESLCGGGGCQQVCTEAGGDDVFFKLCDYGQVMHMTEWRSGQGGGSLASSAVEQAQIEPGVRAVACKVDVYSLGIIVMGMFVLSDARGTKVEERQDLLRSAMCCLAADPSERENIAELVKHLDGDFKQAKAQLERDRLDLLPKTVRKLVEDMDWVKTVFARLLPPSIKEVLGDLRSKYHNKKHRFFASPTGADEHSRLLVDMHIERLVIRSRQVPVGDGADGSGGIEGGGSVSAARMWRISKKSGSMAAVDAGGSTANDCFRRVLIEGEAGIGKSTYLLYLADTQNFGVGRWDDVDAVLYVSLDTLRTRMNSDSMKGVEVGIEHALAVCLSAETHHKMVKGAVAAIEAGELALERIVWLFDGYDEVHTEKGKDTAFGTFVGQLARNEVPWVDRCVVSSRAERGNSKFEECATLQLQKFLHDDVRQFVKEYPWPGGRECKGKASLLNLQVNSDLMELMTVPLMCDLVCYVYSSVEGAGDEGELRVESVDLVLDECYKLLLKRVENRSKLVQALPTVNPTDLEVRKRKWAFKSLEKLAWQCCQDHSLEVELSVDERLMKCPGMEYMDTEERIEWLKGSRNDVLRHMKEGSGFVDAVPGSNGKKHRFFHALIRDYLASRYLFDNWEAVHGGAGMDPAE